MLGFSLIYTFSCQRFKCHRLLHEMEGFWSFSGNWTPLLANLVWGVMAGWGCAGEWVMGDAWSA